jgi:two-component system sensor histidine kinase/response regulator
MDWKMPGLDGLEASRHIKNHQSLNKIPAIILVTAYGREEIMQQAEQIGLDGFLIKPVGSSVLFDTIMHALGEGTSKTARISEGTGKAEGLIDLHGARILLVEDNEINQQVAREILESKGLNVTLANNGQEGVAAAMQNQYDAILMDVQMPVMDGYTAAREIRKWEVGSGELEVGIGNAEMELIAESSKLKADDRRQMRDVRDDTVDIGSQVSNLQPPTSNIPIIAMTAHAMTGDKQKSLAAGMDDHVTKPIDPDKLFATLLKWIRPAAEGPKPQPLDLTSKQVLQTPDAESLPEILPGFELGAGLKRLGGNQRLYRKLLLDFGANYGQTAAQIREALADGDFDQAHSLVHNLKGLAGNLEATDLQAAAVEMEKLVKGQTAETASDSELNRRLAELETAINLALEAVQTLGPPAEEKIAEPSTDALAELSPAQVKEVTDRIKAAAEMGDVMQIQSIADELRSANDAMAPFCGKLIQLAEDFDFDGIQNLLNELDN